MGAAAASGDPRAGHHEENKTQLLQLDSDDDGDDARSCSCVASFLHEVDAGIKKIVDARSQEV